MSWIVGKWYKAQRHYIKFIKIEKVSNYNKINGETISNSKFIRYNSEGYWANDLFEEEALSLGPLENLSEIQEYLPEGHIDRFDSYMFIEDYSYLIEFFKQLKIN